MLITKGDEVIVLAGTDRGKRGRVLAVITKKNAVLVEKVNMVKRHTKAGRAGLTQSEILEKEAPIPACRVALLGKDGKPTRVRYETQSDGSKVRIAVKGGAILGRKGE